MEEFQKQFQRDYQPRYQRSLNHNYLVLRKPEDAAEDYQLRMIVENRIPCLLPMESRSCEGREELYYEISSLQPLARIYEHKEMVWDEVRRVTEAILDAYEKLQDYLLDDTHVVLTPEQIYLDLDDHGISLLFLPYYSRSRGESFQGLAEYYLDRIDHRDMRAAMFAYQFYKVVRREYFVPEDIRRLIAEAQTKGEEEPQERWESTEQVQDTAWTPRAEQRESSGDRSGALPPVPQWDDAAEPVAEEEPAETAARPIGKKALLVLFGGMILTGLVILSGVLPTAQSNGARAVAAALLIVGVTGIFLSLRKKKPRTEEPQDEIDAIFSDMEPRQTVEAGRKRIPEPYDIPAATETDSDTWAPTPTEESYGKTVFMEPAREELRGVLREKGKSREYPIKVFPFTIGKVKDCVDLALPDPSVSRIHARIIKEGGQLYLQDCRSTNGTFLNGMQLMAEEKVCIEKDDEIGIGRLRFCLV